jgi:hypothetical protein
MHICRYHDPTIKQNNKPKYLITKAHYHTYKEKDHQVQYGSCSRKGNLYKTHGFQLYL